MNRIPLNESAHAIASQCLGDVLKLRIAVSQASDQVTVLDFGVDVAGGLNAGLQLARICMAGLATVELNAASTDIAVPQVLVHTDHPLAACLLSQYAGWKIATDDYFAMASGPMRAMAAKEDLIAEFSGQSVEAVAVGVLESGHLPTASALDVFHAGLPPRTEILLAVAPTASQAGNLQVVARSVETAMHKLHEIGFPVDRVVSGCGAAPLPPLAKNDLAGIGRTNDSILYGSTVNLWVDCDDAIIEKLGPQTPSNSSAAHGKLFLNLFKAANHDFYALDKALFSPAVVVFHNLSTGRSFQYGATMPALLHESFGV